MEKFEHKKWIKPFIRFLKDNVIYQQYLTYCHSFQNNRYKRSFKKFLFAENRKYERAIINAFAWDLTSEGYGFWWEINKKWIDFATHRIPKSQRI